MKAVQWECNSNENIQVFDSSGHFQCPLAIIRHRQAYGHYQWPVVNKLWSFVCLLYLFTQLHSKERWMLSAASVCSFVCLFVDTITSERVNIGWWNLGGNCILSQYVHCFSAEFEFGSRSPLGVHPKNVALGYNVGLPSLLNVSHCWLMLLDSHCSQ